MVTHADPDERRRIYRRLANRNRVVALLRWGVPALGALALVGLLGQIYISSLGTRFGISQISIGRDAITVDAPEYAGVLDDGSLYRVRATSARAGLTTADLIDLTDAVLTITRANGTVMDARAPLARLDTTSQLVIVEGVAYIKDSTGTSGTLYQSTFDWAAQTLVGKGPVDVDYADGSTVVARGMTYDAASMVWTFSNATVTLPSTPGETVP